MVQLVREHFEVDLRGFGCSIFGQEYVGDVPPADCAVPVGEHEVFRWLADFDNLWFSHLNPPKAKNELLDEYPRLSPVQFQK